VTEALTAFEDRMIAESTTVEAIAGALFATREDDLARDYLTLYNRERAMEALRLGEALLGSIEARTRLAFGPRRPESDEMSRLDYTMITCRVPPIDR
jgi:secernin